MGGLVQKKYDDFGATFAYKGLIDIRAWISNYIHCIKWDVITHPCWKFNGGLTNCR